MVQPISRIRSSYHKKLTVWAAPNKIRGFQSLGPPNRKTLGFLYSQRLEVVEPIWGDWRSSRVLGRVTMRFFIEIFTCGCPWRIRSDHPGSERTKGPEWSASQKKCSRWERDWAWQQHETLIPIPRTVLNRQVLIKKWPPWNRKNERPRMIRLTEEVLTLKTNLSMTTTWNDESSNPEEDP